MRLVVDTNLMIRALLSAGPARQFFKLAPLRHEVVYHAEQLAELRDVAARPRLKIAPEVVDELIDRIQRYGRRVESELDAALGCRDPKDNYVLALALAGTAEVILTEDQDLLVLDPWRGRRAAGHRDDLAVTVLMPFRGLGFEPKVFLNGETGVTCHGKDCTATVAAG